MSGSSGAMPMDPAQFWGTDWDKHPPLTPVMVEAAQTYFGVRLPKRYISLLEIQNGGYTAGFVFPSPRPTSWAQTHVPLNELSGIGATPPQSSDEFHGIHNIYATPYMTHEWGLPPSQVLLAGDGHWWISLDYRDSAQPRVLWLESFPRDELPLAETFDSFLAGLRPESDLDPETFELPK